MATPKLKYRGAGHFLVGVPARDLEPEEVEASGYTVEQLLELGIYEIEQNQPAPEPTPAVESTEVHE